MGKFSGVLLASDLDGTLIGPDHTLPEANRTALARFMAEGGLFAVSTGRTPLGYEALRPHIPVNAPCVMGNGALIWDFAAGAAVAEWPLRPEVFPCLTEVAEEVPEAAVELHAREAMYVWRPNEWSQAHAVMLRLPYTELARLEDAPEPPYKAVTTGPPEVLARFETLFLARFGARFKAAYTSPKLFEVFDPLAGKGEALETLARRLKIRKEKVYVAGDQQNDREMFDRFFSFAPADGDPALVARADRVVGPCGEGAVPGILDFLDQLYDRKR